MSEFTITAVHGEPRKWSPSDEPSKVFLYWDVECAGEQGGTDPGKTASWRTKDGEPAPSEGLRVDAELVARNGKWELKPVRRGGGGGGKGKSPEERAQIARMNSHAHALAYWRLKHEADPTFRFEKWGDYTAIVDLFYADVKGAS
jgi:hypothetical protein